MWLLRCKEVYINVAQSWNYMSLVFFWFTLGHLLSEGKPVVFKGSVKELRLDLELEAEALHQCKIFSFIILVCCPENLISCLHYGRVFLEATKEQG